MLQYGHSYTNISETAVIIHSFNHGVLVKKVTLPMLLHVHLDLFHVYVCVSYVFTLVFLGATSTTMTGMSTSIGNVTGMRDCLMLKSKLKISVIPSL